MYQSPEVCRYEMHKAFQFANTHATREMRHRIDMQTHADPRWGGSQP